MFEHERLVPEEFGNRVFDTLPDGDLRVALQRESEVVLRVVRGRGN